MTSTSDHTVHRSTSRLIQEVHHVQHQEIESPGSVQCRLSLNQQELSSTNNSGSSQCRFPTNFTSSTTTTSSSGVVISQCDDGAHDRTLNQFDSDDQISGIDLSLGKSESWSPRNSSRDQVSTSKRKKMVRIYIFKH